ncbi:ribonuclease H-like domain-containing protein [Mycena alexandri]|uniref:Ribonuclease H-like domain-containing protein n=1 Tax=Mycena alexandri TaxID=1745969 RepID=A0AAD6SVN8_9AGAR|nr:ribonuclease H-like domain-containing protein [Mycena alexandri]
MANTITDYKIPAGHNFFSEDDNHSELDLLTSEITVPPPSVISALVSQARQRYLDGAESIVLPWTGQLYPLTVLELWSELQMLVRPNIEAWAEGLKWLTDLESRGFRKEVGKTLRMLDTLAWTGHIPLSAMHSGPGYSVGDPILSLTRYLSRDWFASQHIDQMLDVVLHDIQQKSPSKRIEMMTTAITTEILAQYRKTPRDYIPNGDRFIQRFGQKLQDGADTAGVFHVNSNHWVGATVDVIGKSLEFGDPGGGEAGDVDVCAALRWFVDLHLSNSEDAFTSVDLSCTKQRDSHNCGLYASNAIAHKFLPDQHNLISSDVDLGDIGRLVSLRRIITKFHESHGSSVKAAPAIISQRLHEFMNSGSPSLRRSRSTTPPRQENGLSQALRQLSVSPRKPKMKRRKAGNSDSDSESETSLAPIFKRRQPANNSRKEAVTKVVAKEKKASTKPPAAQVKKEKRIEALRFHEEAALLALPPDIENDTPASSGRPRSGVMDTLTVEVESKTTSARAYRCTGDSCPKVFTPRTLARVLAHAKRCLKLTSEQRQYASQHSAATSPGARAEELSQGLSAAQLAPPPPPPEFFGAAGAKQVRERYAALLDLAIVKLFSAAGLPPRLADYPEYKDVFRLAPLAGPHYVPAGRTILMDNHIMSEQERVRGLQLAYLKTQTRLSVSTDGGDIRCGENFYTVHASTSEGRSFILEGIECTLVSHTAEWIADTVMEVMKTVGIERFIAASSDNTGNTRGFRRILCERIPTMLNLPDPNHHLNNTIKDILKIPYFRLPIKILRTAVRTYSQSKQSKAMLKGLRLQQKTGRGLESIGKTRFATVSLSAISVKRNINPLRDLSTHGQVEIKKYNGYFIKNSPKTLDFEMKLSQLIAVTEGMAKAIQCLEAASCNPADVYLLWLAVTAHLRVALAESLLPVNVCNEIRGIVNQRWKEFFVTNPGHGIYLATFYLNPKYVNSDIFKSPNAVAAPTITIPGTEKAREAPIGVRHAKTFFTVGEYLFEQAITEIDHGVDPVLISFKRKKKAFADKFKSQFTGYAQGAFPFNIPIGNMRPIDWWRTLEGSEHGGIITSLALKLYSAVPHSMADERTVSVITWMNPALRNLEKVNTVFSFAQIRGWYRDVMKQKALADGTTKTRAAARPDPEVKFYNIQRDIHGVTDEDDEDQDDQDVDDIVDSDDESDAAVGANMEGKAARVDWQDERQNDIPPSAVLDLDAEIDLASALLLDVLADEPVVGKHPPNVGVDQGFAGMDEDEEADDETDLTLTW